MKNCPSYGNGPVVKGPVVNGLVVKGSGVKGPVAATAMDLSEFQEHFENCEEAFFNKSPLKLTAIRAYTAFQQDIPLVDAQLLTNQ